MKRLPSIDRSILIALTLVIGVSAISYAGEGLYLKLESPQNEYVVREPVKLVITLGNDSGEAIRIPEFQGEDMSNMKFIYYIELITPQGERQCRRAQFGDGIGLINEEYAGEPLFPGDHRELYLYPNATFNNECGNFRPMSCLGATFPEEGKYRIRVFYMVPGYWPKLWNVAGGLPSNELVLTFRKPTPEEAEILDAVWSAGDYISLNSEDYCGFFNGEALRRAIAKYPTHPYIKYAQFALARTLCATDNKGQLKEDSSILETLALEHPDFRCEEVGIALGGSYRGLHETARADSILTKMLRKNPALEDNDRFMTLKFGEGFSDDAGRAVRKWREDRCRAVKPYSKKPRKE
jgi:hypothetical protein